MQYTYESVFGKLVQTIANQLKINKLLIKKETNIPKDLEADSIAFIEIIMKIEDDFNVEIPDCNLNEVKNVDRIVNFILEKKSVAGRFVCNA